LDGSTIAQIRENKLTSSRQPLSLPHPADRGTRGSMKEWSDAKQIVNLIRGRNPAGKLNRTFGDAVDFVKSSPQEISCAARNGENKIL
jgi:hypothetical protein